jgi:hypothetical protein
VIARNAGSTALMTSFSPPKTAVKSAPDSGDMALATVGIELRRAGCRWRVTKPALSIASWVLISTMAAFPEAPL